MGELMPLDRLPEWVPGRILLSGDGLGWRHVGVRAYHYEGQESVVPPMRDYMLVSYCVGATPELRRNARAKAQAPRPSAPAIPSSVSASPRLSST